FGLCVGEVLPQKEICNGIDDDCNGKIDDVMGANVACCPSGKCGVGICTAGMMQCSGGTLSCVGGQGPQGEICNALDDDCNGKNGAPFCQGAVGPMSEACNCKDDDCNGQVDDYAFCPPNTRCVNCGCYGPCQPGEFNCAGGFTCLDATTKLGCNKPGVDPNCVC